MNRTEEVQILKSIYPTTPNAELSIMLGISVSLVAKRAMMLGLRKDANYLSEVNRRCGKKGLETQRRNRYGNT